MNELERKRGFLIRVFYLAVCLGLIYVVLAYLLPFVGPFLVAYVIAFLLQPLIRLLGRKTRLPKKLTALILLILFYLIIGGLLALLSVRLGLWAGEWFAGLPGYYTSTIAPTIEKISALFTELVPSLSASPEPIITFSETINSALSGVIGLVSSFSVDFLTGFASEAPLVLLSIVLTIVSSFFFVVDYDRISSFILRQMTPGVRRKFLLVKSYIVGTLFKFARAYFLIICITFAEVAVGLLILRVQNPFGLALLTAVVDILPILGTGTVMIPWAIFSLVNGDIFLGVGLLVLYTVITVVRQTIEPRIVGRQIGLYPLLTLIVMFVGAQMFGIWGLFGFPIALVVLVHLNRLGEIKLFKE